MGRRGSGRRTRRSARARYLARRVRTSYWRPGCNYLEAIVKALRKVKLRDGDIVVVSEKAISVAEGNIVDESGIRPSLLARLIAKYWMRLVWGYLLGVLSGLSRRTLYNLRNYPLELGARHKELALRLTSPLQALSFGSEGGIDGSNLPYSYVALPLRDPQAVAERIRSYIRERLGRDVVVVISDSDRCYSWRSFHITPRPTAVKGIKSAGGFLTYVICNFLKLRSHPTPVAVAGGDFSIEELLTVTAIAERLRGHGAGRDVWEMARRFGTSLDGVTWEMLESIPHYPIVVVRRIPRKRAERKKLGG